MATTPPNWARDPVTAFIENANQNTYATFVRMPAVSKALQDVDSAFRVGRDGLDNTDHWLPALFYLRSHSSFLGAARLALSGQVAEAYILMRGCLEAALYGHHLFRAPDLAAAWLDRHDSVESKAKSRSVFSYARVSAALKQAARPVAVRVDELYERAIDNGGHPNERSILQSLDLRSSPGKRLIRLTYLSGNTPALKYCLQSTIEVGLASLDVFSVIYHQRFRLLGVDEQLDRIRRVVAKPRAD